MATPEVDFRFSRKTRPAKDRKFLRVSDGDTPVVEQSIRMVSGDTPEKAQYAGKPETAQPKLDRCRDRLENGFYNVPPCYRMWVWQEELEEAKENLNLIEG